MRKNYDRRCPSCGWVKIDSFEEPDARVLCGDCGEPTERIWISKAPSVHGDEMDHLQVNGLKRPRRFTSKIEHRRWLKENGFRIKDDHVGAQGSDKNKFTQRSAIMDPYTLAAATELVSRASKASTRESDHALGITSNDGVIRYLRDRSRNERGEFL